MSHGSRTIRTGFSNWWSVRRKLTQAGRGSCPRKGKSPPLTPGLFSRQHNTQRPHSLKGPPIPHSWGLVAGKQTTASHTGRDQFHALCQLPLFFKMPLCWEEGSSPGRREGWSLRVPAGRVRPASQVWRPQGYEGELTRSVYHLGPGDGRLEGRSPSQVLSLMPSSIQVVSKAHLLSACSQRLPEETVPPGTPLLEISSPILTCPLAFRSPAQPYLQRTASVSDRASYRHRSPSFSSLVTTIVRPRNRAATASLIVQSTHTWNRRSF